METVFNKIKKAIDETPPYTLYMDYKDNLNDYLKEINLKEIIEEKNKTEKLYKIDEDLLLSLSQQQDEEFTSYIGEFLGEYDDEIYEDDDLREEVFNYLMDKDEGGLTQAIQSLVKNTKESWFFIDLDIYIDPPDHENYEADLSQRRDLILDSIDYHGELTEEQRSLLDLFIEQGNNGNLILAKKMSLEDIINYETDNKGRIIIDDLENWIICIENSWNGSGDMLPIKDLKLKSLNSSIRVNNIYYNDDRYNIINTFGL